MTALPPDRRDALRAFVPAETAGKLLAAADNSGERRIVTVLFCDVVGSTALGERLGPERFKIVMDQVLARIVAAVARYEGTVVQVMGDGALAFFGAPLAHEDDAERAVLAALDIRDAIAALSRDLETAYGTTLQVRAGLNTGPVVIARVIDVLEVAYNALGDTVNTAVRLQDTAAPGAILISAETARLVESLFELRALGPVLLRGKTGAVHVAEVAARRALLRKPRGITGLASPLIGRDDELARLRESVQAVLDGRGQVVAVIGEAGIGKSRLIAEAARSHPEVRWLEGRCLSYAAAITYFPFLDLLREWLGTTAADPEAKVRIELRASLDRLFGQNATGCYPYLAAMLRLSLEPDAAARLADLSPESLQHQTFTVMRQWAGALAAERPLGLVLDDLHWADGASLTLLEELVEVTEEAPLLLCLAFRPDREHDCWRLNDLIRRRFPHRHVEIALEPLRPSHADQLISHLLTHPDFSAQIRELILAKAEGNPFFIEEVVRELIAAGILVREGSTWRSVRAATALDVPDNVHGVLSARIDRLSDDARRVLQAAAVIGRLFSLDVLREMLGEDGRVDAAVAELQRHDLVVERRRIPRPEYRFTHALTQEVAYGMLSETQRRRFHGALARVLEEQHQGRLEEIYALLAYHHDRAADEEQAIRFLVRAADKARAEYADQESLRLYARAVELMKRRGEWEAAAQTLMKAALAYHIAFDFPAANRVYQEAFGLLARSPQPRPAPLPPATLRWSALEPAGIDPTRHTDAPSRVLASQVLEGLLVRKGYDDVVPALARSWQISDDGTCYRFELHRDRCWSDGRPVTAHDFVFGWLRGMRGIHAQSFHDIRGARDYAEGRTDDPASVGVRALGDHTLQVVLEGPRSYFPFVLADPTTLPQPRWAVEVHGDAWDRPGHLAANGPYVMTEWEPGRYLRLIRNPRYRGPTVGNVAEVTVVFDRLEDPQLFAEQEVDVQSFSILRREDADRFRSCLRLDRPDYLVAIFFRNDRPPFADRRVRLAFAHATDRRALSTLARYSLLPADGGAVPPALPGHSPAIGIPFDPEAARRLLAAAGFPHGRGLGPFTVPMIGGLPTHELEAVGRQWREILGVEIAIALMPADDYWTLLQTDPPLVGWFATIAGDDPGDVLHGVFHSAASFNVARFRSATFDRLVEDARRSTDQRHRMRLYHEADRLLVADEVAIVPLGYGRLVTLVQPWVKGWLHWHAQISDLIVERPA